MKQTAPRRRDFLLGGLSASLTGGACAADTIAKLARSFAVAGEAPVLRGLIPHGSEANLRPLVESWKQRTGLDILLQVVPVEDVHRHMTLAAMSGETSPDFALPPTFNLQDLVQGGSIQPHDPIARSLGHAADVKAPLYRMGDVIAGQRYGLQTDGDVYMMFYRRDLMDARADAFEDKFGYAPRMPRTWPELDAQMAFFHRPERGQYGGALFRRPGYAAWEFWARMHSKGHLPFTNGMEPRLHEAPAVEALEQMIAATAYLHPDARRAGLFENWTLFKTGQIFCNIGWGGSQKAFHAPGSAVRGRLLFDRLPGDRLEHSSYFNWGWSYVIPKAARHPQLAYLFAAFATAPETSLPSVRARNGYFDPFLAGHYDDPEIQKIYSRPFLSVHRKAIEECIPDLYLPGYGTFFSALTRWIEDAISGRLSAQNALMAASEEWQVAALGRDHDALAAQWQALLAQYPATFVRQG